MSILVDFLNSSFGQQLPYTFLPMSPISMQFMLERKILTKWIDEYEGIEISGGNRVRCESSFLG